MVLKINKANPTCAHSLASSEMTDELYLTWYHRRSAFLFLLKSFRLALTVKGHGTVSRELLGLAPKTHCSLA